MAVGHFKKQFFTNCNEMLEFCEFLITEVPVLAHHGCNAGTLVKSVGD